MTDTTLSELPWLPLLPGDRSYAADLQLGVQLAEDGSRVSLLQQLQGGSVRISTDAVPVVLDPEVLEVIIDALQLVRRRAPERDGDWAAALQRVEAARAALEHTWIEPADQIVPVTASETTPTRSAITALQQLTDEVEAMRAAEAEARGEALSEQPALPGSWNVLPEGGIAYEPEYPEVMVPKGAAHHLIARPADPNDTRVVNTTLCGLDRTDWITEEEAGDAWRDNLCYRCAHERDQIEGDS